MIEYNRSPEFSNHPCGGFSLGTDNVWIYISETWDQNILSLIIKIILFLALPLFSVLPKSAESSLCHILTFTLQIFIGPWIMQGMDFLEKLNPSLARRYEWDIDQDRPLLNVLHFLFFKVSSISKQFTWESLCNQSWGVVVGHLADQMTVLPENEKKIILWWK